jgi:hypothetical protein
MFGPYGLSKLLNKHSQSVSQTQTGEIYHAAMGFIIGLLFYFFLTNFSIGLPYCFDPYMVFLFVAAVPFLSTTGK